MPVPLENKSVRQLFPSPPSPLDGHSVSSTGCEIFLRQRSRATPLETCHSNTGGAVEHRCAKIESRRTCSTGHRARAPREAGRSLLGLGTASVFLIKRMYAVVTLPSGMLFPDLKRSVVSSTRADRLDCEATSMWKGLGKSQK